MNPFSLLKLEWQRFFPNTTFRVVVILYTVFYALLWLLAHKIGSLEMTTNGKAFSPGKEFFMYPQNWELLAFIGKWLNISLIGFLGVFMITLEFSNKTLRQSVIFGMSRTDLFWSKTGSALAVAVTATLFYILLACVGGTEPGGVGATEFALTPAGCTLRFFLQCLGYFFLGTLMGLVIRQTALATLGFLAYVFFFEWVARWVFFFFVSTTRAGLFLPDTVLSSLTPFPLPAMASAMVKGSAFGVPLSLNEAAVAALVYLVLFAVFLQRKFSRSDL